MKPFKNIHCSHNATKFRLKYVYFQKRHGEESAQRRLRKKTAAMHSDTCVCDVSVPLKSLFKCISSGTRAAWCPCVESEELSHLVALATHVDCVCLPCTGLTKTSLSKKCQPTK